MSRRSVLLFREIGLPGDFSYVNLNRGTAPIERVLSNPLALVITDTGIYRCKSNYHTIAVKTSSHPPPPSLHPKQKQNKTTTNNTTNKNINKIKNNQSHFHGNEMSVLASRILYQYEAKYMQE